MWPTEGRTGSVAAEGYASAQCFVINGAYVCDRMTSYSYFCCDVRTNGWADAQVGG